jgi:penicillin amidase
VLAVLLAAAGLGTGLGVYAVRRAFPQASGRIVLSGLQGSVEVMRDRWGVPHIYAQHDLDLFFAQGFVHAQDRLWQMEFNRRAASGRLSEMFGQVTLDTDRFLRTVGLRRAAEAEAAQLDEETKRVLQAYADGVNAYVASRRGRLPLEFTLLRHAPEPWSPVDSIAFGKLMAWTLSGNWDSEILRAHLLSRFGEAGIERLLPAYPAGMPVIVPAGADYRPFRSPAALRLAAHAPARNGIGSNNWVIAGARTTTGKPILANDPHLEAAMPSIWYEMDLSSERFHVTGATFAGTPGVIIGHNEHIAWGVTNAGPDVQDLYLERFDPDDPTRYEFRGQWERATVVEEVITVKGRRDPVTLPVRITRHGPILNGVVEGLDAFVALRWTALDPGTILNSVLRLNQARNWEEFREALRLWTVPAQNFVYADTDGNIGYQLPGRIPVRAKGNGLLPVPGWTGEYEWVGEIPFDELPSSFNPERGYIITANNRIIPDGYTHFIAAEWDPGFRAQRIETMLAAQPKVSPEVVADMQLDTTSLPAQTLLRALGSVQITEEPEASLLAELRAWDGVLAPESRAAAIYEAFRVALPQVLFEDLLGPDMFKRYLDRSDAWTLAILRLLNEPSSPWWGPAGRDALVAKALVKAEETLTQRLGSDQSNWTWGRLHIMRFEHPIGRVPVLGRIFNAIAPPTGGDAFTVNNGGFSVKTFRQVVVASYRQILEVGNWDRSMAIHTTGQSGLPFHRHYKDFVMPWATGQYHPLFFSSVKILETVESSLTLAPP